MILYLKCAAAIYTLLGVVNAIRNRDEATYEFKHLKEKPLKLCAFLLLLVPLRYLLLVIIWPYWPLESWSLRRWSRKHEEELLRKKQQLPPPDPELMDRRVTAFQRLQERMRASGGKAYPDLYDPLEDEPGTAEIIRKVKKQVDLELKGQKPWMGQCHLRWARMQYILKEEHGITWYKPSQMNPDIRYD